MHSSTHKSHTQIIRLHTQIDTCIHTHTAQAKPTTQQKQVLML